MSVTKFIPQVWSARMLVLLRKSLVYGMLLNRDYEGEISQFGDTVHINSVGRPTITDYTKYTALGVPEQLTDAQRDLVINQAKAFNFMVDDVDQAQVKGTVLEQGISEAVYGLADVTDQYAAATLYTGVQAGNLIASDASPLSVVTPASAFDLLVDLGVKLDEANVPRGQRWVVVPPWFEGVLTKDTRLIGQQGAQSMLVQGFIGRLAGFEIYASNNVPNVAGAKYKIIAGVAMAATMAEQINKVEAYRPQSYFSDAVKGLHLYGAKLVRPDAVAVATVNRT